MNLDALRFRKWDKHIEDTKFEESGFQFVTECEHGNCRGHFALYADWNVKYELGAFGDRTGL